MSHGAVTLGELQRALRWLGVAELNLHIGKQNDRPAVYTASTMRNGELVSCTESDLPGCVVGLLTMLSPKT